MELADKIVIFIMILLMLFAWMGFCATVGHNLHLTDNQTFLILISPFVFILIIIWKYL